MGEGQRAHLAGVAPVLTRTGRRLRTPGSPALQDPQPAGVAGQVGHSGHAIASGAAPTPAVPPGPFGRAGG